MVYLSYVLIAEHILNILIQIEQFMCSYHLGLHPRASVDSRLGLYNGEEVVLTTSEYNLVSAVRFYWRYGRDIFRLQTYIDEFLDSFNKYVY